MRYAPMSACLALLLLCATAYSQDPKPSPTIEDYEIFFKKYKDLTDKAFKPEAWKDLNLTNTKTKEVKKFGELSKKEQHTIMLMLGDRFTREMTNLSGFWDKEVAKFADPKHALVPRAKIENDKQKPAMKDDVVKYRDKLLAMRKRFAVEYESYVEKMLKTFEKDFEAKERDHILKEVRDLHDELKLIERKKDKK